MTQLYQCEICRKFRQGDDPGWIHVDYAEDYLSFVRWNPEMLSIMEVCGSECAHALFTQWTKEATQ